ncbi:probable chitinase 2 isoform X2 [Folsomia candida]|uniref:Putative chitinase 2 n=2 Tax=Folsomia candida TaxID=158441 RepID=A0A226EGN6_FOLCA|nr:probable chitinase 2 isoform X2 [Folsomia candida]OXA56244.1 putative chitinase 2 [Folsomia candida]
MTMSGWTSIHFLVVVGFVLLFLKEANSVSNTVSSMDEGEDPSVREVTNLNLTFRGDYQRARVQAHKKVVVCYVATWATYRKPDEGAFDIDHIEPNLCTHLIYSFAGLDNTTFIMKPLDPWLDQKLQENGGGREWFKRFNDFKAKYPHLKVLLAIGGWNEGSKKYSQMAGNSQNRQVFIQSALDLIQRYGFDGLDLDWEFPADRGGSMDDKRQFTILVQELRHKFDKYGLMLTSAFGPALSTATKGYELRELAGLLDHIHLMCYDYHGAWDRKTGHNAPLYAPKGDGSIAESVDYYLAQGVPPHKLVIGLPFYGRTFIIPDEGQLGDALSSSTGRNASVRAGLFQGAMDKGFQGPYTKEDGFLGYNEICRELTASRGDWTTYWDDVAKVPYMRNGNKWVSFDNPDSIREKVKYITQKKLRGAMIWSIDTDDFRSTCGIKNALLRTVNFALYQNVMPGDDVIPSTPGRGPLRPTAGASGLQISVVLGLIAATVLYFLG